jgi:prepilin-type N-terminal cleavage/methylation domain-containing protein
VTTLDSRGFTLLELLIVTVMLGILAAIAFPIYRGFREDAAIAALKEELRLISTAEEMHFVEFDRYTDDPARLDYRLRDDVQLELRTAGGGGGSGGSGGGPPGGGPPGGGPPGGGPPGGGPPGGGPPGGGPPGGGPPGGGPPGGGGSGSGGASGGGDPSTGWAGRVTDPDFGVRCAVVHGNASPYDPATIEGEIACDDDA